MSREIKALRELMEINKELEYIDSINKNLLYWDSIKNMPEKGMAYRQEVIAYLSKERFRLSNNKRIKTLLEEVEAGGMEDIKVESMLRKIRRNQKITELIPEDEYIGYYSCLNQAELAWNQARERNDFKLLVPHLKEIIAYLRKFVGYFGYEDDLYDGILAYNFIDLRYEQLGPVFENIKNTTREILGSLSGRQGPRLPIKADYPIDGQKTMTREILSYIGFDFKAGRVDIGNYPTVLPVSNQDVRIFTSYDLEDFKPGLTTAFHTGAQAVYEQGIDSSLYSYLLAEPASTTIQEAVARYYENIIGKGQGFWKFYYPRFQEIFPAYEDLSLKDFYRDLNRVSLNPIRMDSDELTYNLHIILRTELEHDLINGLIEVEDLSQVWKERFSDYFKMEVLDDKDGILQDVHWVSGYYGYFPNYLLGNIYAAQIDQAIREKIPSLDQQIEAGDFVELNEWFNINIYSQGALYNTNELMLIATGEVLNDSYYRDYLVDKFGDLNKLWGEKNE